MIIISLKTRTLVLSNHSTQMIFDTSYFSHFPPSAIDDSSECYMTCLNISSLSLLLLFHPMFDTETAFEWSKRRQRTARLNVNTTNQFLAVFIIIIFHYCYHHCCYLYFSLLSSLLLELLLITAIVFMISIIIKIIINFIMTLIAFGIKILLFLFFL